jgi:hypothetical protein
MGIKITKQDIMKVLEIIADDKSENKCPVCGNDIVIVENGTSYSVKCKTKDCVDFSSRGI